ncbi:MAG: class II aldolase/adducin family protein [Proteobacteria bacterium]|nr:MAG: class II aldolase/adducin family protein [Pseudomonadota bacterium]
MSARIAEAEHLVEICRRLHGKNMLASADGNVSLKISEEEILITPTGVNKARLKASDVAVITLDNKIISGKPSSERLMHLEVYRRCFKARAIVHAHPPTAIAFTVANPKLAELPAEALSELILAVGRVPIAPYARPGSLEMGTVLHPYLPACRVMILARHGALSWGEDPEEAYNGMERLEHVCQILKSAVAFGGITSLPAEEVEALREMRKTLGERTL